MKILGRFIGTREREFGTFQTHRELAYCEKKEIQPQTKIKNRGN
jgi:hypothetical protein